MRTFLDTHSQLIGRLFTSVIILGELPSLRSVDNFGQHGLNVFYFRKA